MRSTRSSLHVLFLAVLAIIGAVLLSACQATAVSPTQRTMSAASTSPTGTPTPVATPTSTSTATSSPTSTSTTTTTSTATATPILIPAVPTLAATVASAATTPPTNPATSPKGHSRTITLADNGTTITLHPGDRFLLELGNALTWNVTVADPSVVNRVPNILVIRGAQGIYEAHQPGQTTITAIGSAACRGATPPCAVPDRLFHVTIVVR